MAKRTKRGPLRAAKELELAEKKRARQNYVLRLYVAGMTPRSDEAIRHVKALCDKHLSGRCDLQVIDIYQQPTLAKGEQIIAAPTLIRKLPLPLRKIIGNMALEEKLLVGLDLRARKP
ncbi:MAG: circadian clock KaiB family protein [Elusimicrobia bacterium]|nr:circadian clock KaiB family protein [Elusimicrobiota bacterium]